MSSDPDRLDWIFDDAHPASLQERYDVWAATYDSDHDAWGWRGPDLVAAATVRHIDASAATATIIDAGCGTGMAGIALRRAGWTGGLVGLDLSSGMLGEASKSDAYDDLVKCSLYDIPLAGACAVAIVSSGVFTLGHVGGEALRELRRVTAPGGVVTVTQRLELADRFAPHVDALSAAREWVEIEQTTPDRLHPDRDDVEQTVISWRVRT